MTNTCMYPGCENEPQPGEEGAEAKYCGLPDPVSGKPHTALTSFRRRREVATHGSGAADPEEDPGRPREPLWHRRRRRHTDEERHLPAEAAAEEARAAMLEADAQLAAALAAQATAEQAAVAAAEVTQARIAEAERAAAERELAAQQERDDAVSGARRPSEEAADRVSTATQDAPLEHSRDEAREPRLSGEGSILDELVDSVYEAVDWLLHPDI
jgi:hypothetical protein